MKSKYSTGFHTLQKMSRKREDIPLWLIPIYAKSQPQNLMNIHEQQVQQPALHLPDVWVLKPNEQEIFRLAQNSK